MEQKNVSFRVLLLGLMVLFSVLCQPSTPILASTEEADEMFDMSLDELMNIKIELASKKKEPVFEAPLSSTVLTREDIMKSGALSIPEALRLVPGLLVREQANGIFDVHIRGGDNIPPGSSSTYTMNTTTLVMIDNRIVYEYYLGAIHWDSISVGLNDIERIEIVRGPSAAMYGPNAVSGVINIVTQRPEREGFYSSAECAVGGFTDNISAVRKGTLSLSYHSARYSAGLSGNIDKRERSNTEYYSWYSIPPSYVKNPEDIGMLTPPYSIGKEWGDARYPDPDTSLKKYCANGFITLKPSDKVSVDLSAGLQDSRAQKIYFDTGTTPFLTYDTDSFYGNLKIDVDDFSVNVDYLDGEMSTLGFNNDPGYSDDITDMSIFHSKIEYTFKKDALIIRPYIGYNSATYKSQFFGGFSGTPQDKTMYSRSASIFAEYTFPNSLRIIGSIRADKYDYKSDLIYNSLVAGTYQIGDNHIVRASYGRAYRSPFLRGIKETTFYNYGAPYLLAFQGNEDMDQMKKDTVEVGFRSKLSDKLKLDSEVFYSSSKDYYSRFRPLSGDWTMDVGGATYNKFLYQNQDISAEQIGITLSLVYTLEKYMVNTFVTYQRTTIDGRFYSVDWNDVATPMGNTYKDYDNVKHTSTPDFFGGLVFNWKPVDRILVNINSYFYTNQTLLTERGDDDVNGNILVNAKVSYEISRGVFIYSNIRNLSLLNKKRQYGAADEIDTLFLLGMSYQF